MPEETDVARRVARLEAEQEIERLMAEYLYLVDREPDPDRIAALFSEDGVWEPRGNLAVDQQTARGRAAVRELFAGVAGAMPFLAHFITNAAVEVADDGRTARGRWHTFELMSLADPPVQVVQLAWYENDFVREGEEWRIAHIRFEDSLSFPFSEGWGATRFVSLVTGQSHPYPGPAGG
jgi:ketosteroid isomerase-like protein